MRLTVGDKVRMEGTDHVMVDGNGVKSRFNGWRPASTPLRKYPGGVPQATAYRRYAVWGG